MQIPERNPSFPFRAICPPFHAGTIFQGHYLFFCPIKEAFQFLYDFRLFKCCDHIPVQAAWPGLHYSHRYPHHIPGSHYTETSGTRIPMRWSHPFQRHAPARKTDLAILAVRFRSNRCSHAILSQISATEIPFQKGNILQALYNAPAVHHLCKYPLFQNIF